MEFSIQSDVLGKYLQLVRRVISGKASLPILNNILFEIEGKTLTILGTDLETQIVASLPIPNTGSKKIRFGVNARVFAQYIGTLPPAESITLALQENKLLLTSPHGSTQFNTVALADYPVLEASTTTKVIELPNNELAAIFNQVTFAGAKDHSKPILTGCLLEFENEQVNFVTLDGYRLSLVRHALPQPVLGKESYIVSINTLEHVHKILLDLPSDEIVSFAKAKDNNYVLFEYQDIKVFSRLLEGEYPAYRQLIPTAHQTKVTVNKEAWLSALKRVGVFAQLDISQKIILSFSGDNLEMTSELSEIGDTKDTTPISKEGDDLKVAFQSRYLQDALNHLDGEDITFEAVNSESPGVFKPMKGDSFIHLIMPLDLGE